MRKAYTLIELLVIIVLLPFVMVAISGIFVVFLRDIPRDTRLLQQNTSILDLTRQLARDMDSAKGLPDTGDGLTSNRSTLLIALPGQLISYELADGTVRRRALTQDRRGSDDTSHTWRIPDATVTWQRRRQAGQPHALELHTHFRRRVGDHEVNKLANSHLYFIHALGKAREVE